MKTLRTVAQVRQHLAPIRRDAIIGLAPTMGALHDGHVALFRAARARCDHAVATIFVNPGQFTIGDTLHTGPPVHLPGVPRFPAEHFGRVRLQDTRFKQFDEGLRQRGHPG